MNTLPQPIGALEFAKAEVETMRDEPIPLFGLPLRWFDKQDNRTLARQIMKALAMQHPTRLMRIADWGRQGWSLADEAIRELIVECMEHGHEMPLALRDYNSKVVALGPVKRIRGQQKADNFLRDIAITIIVERVCDRFGLQPTGNSARTQSGCAIVAEALASTERVTGLGYKGVAEIWRRWGAI